MLAALRRSAPRVMTRGLAQSVEPRVSQLLINGKFVPSQSGKTFETHNPATEEKICDVAEAESADVDAAVAAAQRAFEDGPWRKMSGQDRSRVMFRLAELMEEHLDELAVLESMDSGKTVSVARDVEVLLAIRAYRYYAGWADKMHGMTLPLHSNHLCYTRHEPVGVTGQITPWNFPILMQTWKLGPALAAGCTSVLKPAEQTPLTALRVGELALKAGIPPGVVNVLPGFGPTAGAPLVEHPGVNKIAFTGSTDVGYDIMRTAPTHNLKRVTLELGGKSPNIIFPDADMDEAIEQSQLGLFLNQGQCCVAGSRIFVHEDIYDEFVKRSVEAAAARKVGDPTDPATVQGPQVSAEQRDRVMSYIEQGKREGAELLLGGGRHGDKGFFVEPTVFAGVQDDMVIAQEEIFGPVMPIMKFSSEEEVIRRANASSYGLGAGVMTSNVDRAIRMANALRCGTVYINCYDVFDPATTFGGFKDSGVGRELGPYGMSTYTEVKTVIMRNQSEGLH